MPHPTLELSAEIDAYPHLSRETLAAVHRWLRQRDGTMAPDRIAYLRLRGLLDTVRLDMHLSAAFETLAALLDTPTESGPVGVCYACVRIAEWAHGRNDPGTARAFLDAARRAAPRMAESLAHEAVWTACHA